MGNISQINGLQITAATASYAATASFVAGTVISASYALSASYAPSTPAFPYTGSAIISGSLIVTGSITQNASTASFGGLVGIGTTTPANTLDVNGTARVQGDITSTAGIKSIVSSVTAQYNAYNPSNNYPRAQFQIGQNSSDVNIGLTISPLYSSTGVQKPCFIQVSTNKNISDTGQFSGYFIANTSIFTIGTNKQDGQVSGGLPIILAPAGTEAMRIFTNSNIAIGTTTDSGFKLDVNGTARVQDTLTATANTSNGCLVVNQNGVGFPAQIINRVNTTNAMGMIQFSDQKTGAGNRSFGLGIGRSGDPSWTNGDFIFSYYPGSGGWLQSAKIFNASGNWVIGTTTTDAGYKLDVNGTSAYRNTISVLPPLLSTAQTGLQIYRGASTSTVALSIGITSGDDVIFNTANADYIFNRSNVERFRIGNTSITTDYQINPKVTIPTGTTINYGLNVSNAAGAQRMQLGIDASENAVVTLGNLCDYRIRNLASSGYDVLNINGSTGNVVIEKIATTSTAIPSAKLALNSTTSGFLPPRMTTTEKNAIASPAAGLVVYDTTLNKLCVYTTAWETITSV